MEILKNNWKLKLISIIVAIFLWFYVIGLENPTMTKQFRDIEVVVQKDEILNQEGYSIVDKTPQKIDIEISGKRNSLNQTNANDIYAYVELGQVNEGPVSREIKFQTPSQVSITNTSSKDVNFQIEKNITKDINVSIEYKNELPKDYVLEESTPSPNQISVLGVRSQIDKIDKLQALVNLENIKEDQMVNINIIPVDKEGAEVKNITLGQSFVNVALDISKTREVSIDLNTVNDLPDDVAINSMTIEPNKVLIKGSEKDVEKINKLKTKPIDLSNIKEGNKNIDLILPEGISLFNPNSKFLLTVDFDEKVTKDFEYLISNIQVENLRDGLIHEFEKPNDKLLVKIEGFSKEISSLTNDDIKVKVDLRDLNGGSHVIKPYIDDNDRYDLIRISPDSIGINLKEK